MRSKLFVVILFLLLVSLASAQDGIPDNCEYSRASYYRANVFPRYEAHNRRLLLVDWQSGADVQIIAENLDDTLIRAWSLDCRYLAVAVGTSASRDTVVFDTLTNTRVGAVADAHRIPHPVTWGPGNLLVVETRDGGILWNVEQNWQVPLHALWNDSWGQNFQRLRWDAANAQLIANFYDGGRTVYDLTTGQTVPQVTAQNDAIPGDGQQVLLGGGAYDCVGQYRYGYRQWYRQTGPAPGGIFPYFDFARHQLFIGIYDGSSEESLVVLENDLNADSFRSFGWSSDCRYLAGALEDPQDDTSDTAVWDVQAGRRVGTIPDARAINHPFYWHPSLPVALVESRNGAILWHVTDNRQIVLETGSQTALTGQSAIANFRQFQWNAAGTRLYGVPVNHSGRVVAYDLATGAELAYYELPDSDDVSFTLSPDDSRLMLCCGADGRLAVYTLDGTRTILQGDPSRKEWNAAFSPDNRYLVWSSYQERKVLGWDLTALLPDGSPNFRYVLWLFNPVFVDAITLASGDTRVDIRDGIQRDRYETQLPAAAAPIEGQSGSSTTYFYTHWWYTWNRSSSNCPEKIAIYNPDDRVYTLADRAQFTRGQFAVGLLSSPDCRWLVGSIPYIAPSSAEYNDRPVDDTYRERLSDSVAIWDALSGQLLRLFDDPHRYESWSGIRWSPGGDRLFIRTTNGSYLYHPASNHAALLTFDSNPGGRDGINTNYSVYWDYQRGQVLVSGWAQVYAFDMQTGQERNRFAVADAMGCYFYGCSMSVSSDNRILYVFGRYNLMGIWNLDTLEHEYIAIRQFIRFGRVPVAINPGWTHAAAVAADQVFVWDFSQLTGIDYQRQPTAIFNAPTEGSIRFVDEFTLEIRGDEIYQFNVLDGTFSLHTG